MTFETMPYNLSEILKEIGTLTVPSIKAEISFSQSSDDTLWVSVRTHNPDGTYGDHQSWKFTLTDD